MTALRIPRFRGLGLLVVALASSGCTRPLGAWFPEEQRDGSLPDATPWPDGGRPDGALIPDGAINRPPTAICPEERHTAPGRAITLYGDGEDDWGIVSWRWEVVSQPSGANVLLGSPAARDTSFVTDAVGNIQVRLTVTDAGGLSDSCETRVVSTVSAPLAICPEDVEWPTRTPMPLHGEAQDDGYIVSWQWEVVSHDTDTDPTLSPATAQDTTFEALRVGHYVVRLTVTDEHGLTDMCQLTITTTPTPPDAVCPAGVTTAPFVPVQLNGSAVDDGQIASVSWSLVTLPAGSSASPPSPANQLITTFTPDIVGTYVLQLEVIDDDGNPASCTVTVDAYGQGLRVVIYWNPPENPSDTSDVDLHLLHPDAPAWDGGSNDLDCYFANCVVPQVLDWDVPGYSPDNPRLDIDDTNGYGPENINIDEPVDGAVYRVGVHYYSNNGWSTTAQVYVRIFCGDIELTPVYEAGPMALHGGGDPSTNDFWKVADVTWTGYTCQVSPIDQVVPHWQAAQSR